MAVEISVHEHIRQLACRYAQAVDSRDLDALMECFPQDVQVGRDRFGRDALRAWFDEVLRSFGVSMHMIGNHRIDVQDEDHATGIVYCRAEHALDGEWLVMMIQYWDTYQRIDGQWFFRRRKEKVWYGQTQSPSPGGPFADRWPGREPKQGNLPYEWPSWTAFWGDARAPLG